MNRADLTLLTRQRLCVTFFVVASLTAANATAQSEWITLIDGTEGIENFNLIGDANWTAEMASIRATQGGGHTFMSVFSAGTSEAQQGKAHKAAGKY